MICRVSSLWQRHWKLRMSPKVNQINVHAFPMTPLMKIQNWSYTLDAIRNQIELYSTEGAGSNRQRSLAVEKDWGNDTLIESLAAEVEVTIAILDSREILDLQYAVDILQYAVDKVAVATTPDEETPSNDDSIRLRGRRQSSSNNNFDLTSCTCLDVKVDNVFAELSEIVFLISTDSALDRESNVECILSYMAAFSAHPSTYSVSTDKRPQTWNDMAQQIVQAGDLSNLGQPLRSRPDCPFFEAGLTASNQIIGLSDTGIDEASCYFRDASGPIRGSAYYPNQNLDDVATSLSKRKIVQYAMHPSAESGDGYNGHGSHVAGTLAGRRSTDGDLIEDERGFGDGIALDAKISFMDIGRHDGSLRIWKNEHLFLPAVSAGAFLHSMSWGYSSSGYNTLTHNIDRWLYDNEDQLVIVAAGNRGSSNDSIGTLAMPAGAKNIISVGASQSDGPDISIFEQGLEYVASYSSQGPAGLRTKPDVVAPGHRLLSADGRLDSTGTCDKDGLKREDYLFQDDPSNGLRYASGSSMAAPVVTGMASQIRQYFIGGFYPQGRRGIRTTF